MSGAGTTDKPWNAPQRKGISKLAGSKLQMGEKVRAVESVDVIGNRSSFWACGYEASEVEASRNARPLVGNVTDNRQDRDSDEDNESGRSRRGVREAERHDCDPR